MILSVIIVSYNVKYFLGQCLSSVYKAIDTIDPGNGSIPAEVFVVDNHSTDGSIGYLQSKFPTVHFIQNIINAGFAKANNQALIAATGEYVLFLNPDTIVPEDCFLKCISFMKSHADAGASGVKMINGQGAFLKESKRGFPSPWVSFWKMTGLTGLFPRSGIFAKYYLGHLDENTEQQADILSGAFLFVKKEVLDKTGGFDERFFMYAEDIDLSYRIIREGYKNYYNPSVIILHYKGESTRKDIAYVKQFYKAMSQFVEKHFTKGPAKLYTALLNTAIRMRSGIETLKTMGKKPTGTGMRDKMIFLKGDVECSTGLKEILKTNTDPELLGYGRLFGKGVISNEEKADTVVLCQGCHYSFAEAINYMYGHPGKEYIVHARNV